MPRSAHIAHKDVSDAVAKEDQSKDANVMISCFHLSVKHPRMEGALLDDVSFEIETGGWAEFTGEAGCGKSLLFSMLSLRARPEQGTMIVAGRNIARLPQRKLERLRAKIGSCQQSPLLLEDRSVVENLLLPFVARKQLKQAPGYVDHILEQLELQALRDLPVHMLSSSERRVVGIARACVGDPSMILIDGAFEQLDLNWKKRVRAHLRRLHREGRTVVLFGRESVGPMTGRGVELRMTQSSIEPVERSVHAPAPEIGRRRP